ncbi:MAG: hypothetical protein ABGW82_09925 [Paracoccus sp. (in: a-proteobacteria)]
MAIIRDLVDAGCRRIEIGSFVSPRAVPQMADMDRIAAETRCCATPKYCARI